MTDRPTHVPLTNEEAARPLLRELFGSTTQRTPAETAPATVPGATTKPSRAPMTGDEHSAVSMLQLLRPGQLGAQTAAVLNRRNNH
ncbi:hypothetical protein [Citricoccus alkalitolerans]|uniref:Uncharacterized protein n=1 Tax=Citricoccus alkalitolerans TaxID=246603 RepID=A0ABV8Y1B8_9MICC